MKCFLTTKVPKAASCLWSPVGKLFLLLALFVCSTSVHALETVGYYGAGYGGYTYCSISFSNFIDSVGVRPPLSPFTLILDSVYNSPNDEHYVLKTSGSIFVPDWIWTKVSSIEEDQWGNTNRVNLDAPVHVGAIHRMETAGYYRYLAEKSFPEFRGDYISIGNYVSTLNDSIFPNFGEGGKPVTLVLGEGVRNMEKAFQHVGEDTIGSSVICLGDTLPTIDSLTFKNAKNTTFYVKDEEAYKKYKADDSWRRFDSSNNQNGNKYAWPIPFYYETNTPNKWQTIIFPNDLTIGDVTNIFGERTRVAELDSASWNASTSTYNLTFRQKIDLTNMNLDIVLIKANTPYFIWPQNPDAHYASVNTLSAGSATYDKGIEVTGATGKIAHMVGNVTGKNYTLAEKEFYFRNGDDGKAYFYESNGASFVKPAKCYFKITDKDGNNVVHAKIAVSLDDTVTGISETTVQRVQKKGIYTIDGLYRGNDFNSLPKGLYIVNGKKVIK